MDAAVARHIARAFDARSPEEAVLVAETPGGGPLGFVYLVTVHDYFTEEAHGHVSDLVVAREGEGRGVGRALLEASEKWAAGRGYRLLSLHVFEENRRARRLYDRVGYEPELARLVKVLR